MAISNQVVNFTNTRISDEVLEKVIINQDLSPLKPLEKIEYIKNLCLSLGLNPLTKPFEIMKFNGKEVPYARKDCTEQLRRNNNVSIVSMENKMITDGIYVVTAHAKLPNGREDSSTGVVNIQGLKGEALANAMMKAETKAKRRVTLSISGLGFIDESEVDSIPNAKKIDIYQNKIEPAQPKPINCEVIENNNEDVLNEALLELSQCASVDELQEVYKNCYKFLTAMKDKESLKKLIEAKDKKKSDLEMVKEFNAEIDSETGEVK